MKLSGNFAFPTMLQPRHGLEKLKIENCNQFSIFFSAKTLKIVNRTTQEGGCTFAQLFFFAPVPLPPLPDYTSLERSKWKFIFTTQSLFQT